MIHFEKDSFFFSFDFVWIKEIKPPFSTQTDKCPADLAVWLVQVQMDSSAGFFLLRSLYEKCSCFSLSSSKKHVHNCRPHTSPALLCPITAGGFSGLCQRLHPAHGLCIPTRAKSKRKRELTETSKLFLLPYSVQL